MVERLQRESAELDAQVTAAIETAGRAKTTAEHEAAMAALRGLQRKQAEHQRQMDKAKADADAKERKGGFHPTNDCLSTPLFCQ